MPQSNDLQELQHSIYKELDQCQQNCKALLHGTRLQNLLVQIDANINTLKVRFRTSLAGDQNNGGRRKFEPLTPAPAAPVDLSKPPQKTVADNEGDQLAAEVEALYNGFADREPGEALDALTEMQIRGIARMAGLDYTETFPEKINLAVIADIQAAIHQKASGELISEDPLKAVEVELSHKAVELERVQTEKEGVEKALEKEKGAAKRATLQTRLATLTEQETEITLRIDDLKQALVSNEVED